jgi:uncharacterized protein YueI
MKNVNTTQRNQMTNQETSLNQELEFGDVVVYHEMADQTSVRLNLVVEIHAQLNQIDEMLMRKQYLMKEILNELDMND